MVDAELAQSNPDLRPGPCARLSVSDTGKGMDATTLERIFDPFFTTKEVGKRTGLGLSVAHGIMKNCQGAIQVVSRPGQGTTFMLYFPAASGERTEAPAPVTPVELQHGKGRRILFLDDEQALVVMASHVLERRGYYVTGLSRAAEALAMIRRQAGAFDLVVADYNMPDSSGIDVVREIWKLRADLPVIMTSENVSEELEAEAEALGLHTSLHKPYTMEEVCKAVHDRLHPSGETS